MKDLGWTLDSFSGSASPVQPPGQNFGKGVASTFVGDHFKRDKVMAAMALYGTLGLPLLNRGVRDALTEIEANRSWMVTSPRDAAIGVAAADLILAIRRIAPEAKTITVRRKQAETQA